MLLSRLASLSPLFIPPHILSRQDCFYHMPTFVDDHSENTPVLLVLPILSHLLVLTLVHLFSRLCNCCSAATSLRSLLTDIANRLHVLAHCIDVAIDNSKFFASNRFLCIYSFSMSLISKCSINPSLKSPNC